MISSTAREKARELRYKRSALDGLNYDYIYDTLAEIEAECDNVRYFMEGGDDTLLNALDGDEEEEYEFRMMFADLSAKCEELRGLIDHDFPERFDDFFVGIMLKNKSPYRLVGFDSYEEDYFGLLGYTAELAENEAFKRLMRLTKEEIITTAGRCFAAAVIFLDVREKYSYLKAAFDILRDKNTSFLQVIRDIDKAYDEADADGWNKWCGSYAKFEKLVATLPDQTWVE